jgi:hypothetical protein
VSWWSSRASGLGRLAGRKASKLSSVLVRTRRSSSPDLSSSATRDPCVVKYQSGTYSNLRSFSRANAESRGRKAVRLFEPGTMGGSRGPVCCAARLWTVSPRCCCSTRCRCTFSNRQSRYTWRSKSEFRRLASFSRISSCCWVTSSLVWQPVRGSLTIGSVAEAQGPFWLVFAEGGVLHNVGVFKLENLF